jgi:hypothetical protein
VIGRGLDQTQGVEGGPFMGSHLRWDDHGHTAYGAEPGLDSPSDIRGLLDGYRIDWARKALEGFGARTVG